MGLFGTKSKEKAELKAQAKTMTAQAPVGASGLSFQSEIPCESVFAIEPKPIEVGVKRSKDLKGRLVVHGTVRSGQFKTGETVAIVGSDGIVKAGTTILDLIPDNGTLDFLTELSANMHSKEAGLGTDVWMILDVTEGILENDLIGKI